MYTLKARSGSKTGLLKMLTWQRTVMSIDLLLLRSRSPTDTPKIEVERFPFALGVGNETKDTLHVPGLRLRLFSVSQFLDSEPNSKIIFKKDGGLVYRNNHLAATLRRRGNLYVLEPTNEALNVE